MTVKRLNYFKGQFLKATDFKDEQKFHKVMLAKHNAALHTWGIAEGLTVEFLQGEKKVTVKSGTAIDSLGRSILLMQDTVVDLSSSISSQPFITIRYEETETDPSNETGVEGNTRVSESPVLSTVNSIPGDPSTELVLAKVTLNQSKVVTKVVSDARKGAGALVKDLEVEKLSFKLDAAPDLWPNMSGRFRDGNGELTINSYHTEFSGSVSGSQDSPLKAKTATGYITIGSVNAEWANFNTDRTKYLFDKEIRVDSGKIGSYNEDLSLCITGNAKMTVKTDGKVGIGTTTPAETLHVNGAIRGNGPGGSLYINTDNGYLIAGPQDLNFCHLQTNRNRFHFNKPLSIQSGMIGSVEQDLKLQIANATKIIIKNDTGNVGIGTTTPAETLHVNGSVRGNQSGALRIQSPTGYVDVGSKSAGLAQFYTSCNQYYFDKEIRVDSGMLGSYNEDLSLCTTGNVKMTVKTNGNVGIGTTAPAETLHVNGSVRGDQSGALRIQSPTGYVDVGSKSAGLAQFYTSCNQYYFDKEIRVDSGMLGSYNEDLSLCTTGNVKMTVKTNGNVGIGTTAPAETLHVNGSVRGNQSGALRIQSPTGYVDVGSKSAGLAQFYTSCNQYYFDKEVRVDSGMLGSYNEDLSLCTTGNVKMTVKTNGNVGIGTTAPAARLQITGGSDAGLNTTSGYLIIGDGAGENVALDNNEIMARNNGAAAPLYIQNDGGDLFLRNNKPLSTKVVFKDDGKVGIGTVAPNHKLHVDGETRTDGLTLSPGGGWWHRTNGDAGIVCDNGTYKALMIIGSEQAGQNKSRWIRMWDTVTVQGSLEYTGTLTKSSSRVLKENISNLTTEEALKTLKQLNPVKYVLKADKTKALQLGFIAEDSPREIAPDQKGVIDSNIITVLTKIVKEQQRALETLTTKLNLMEGKPA